MSDAQAFGVTFPKRVLLLGGDPQVTELVRNLFAESDRYVLKEERSRRMTMRTARAFRPDAIFYGQTAQEQGWKETLAQIKSDPALRLTPIFILAISPDGESAVYGGSLDGYDFSAEPMTIDELVHSFDQVLQD